MIRVLTVYAQGLWNNNTFFFIYSTYTCINKRHKGWVIAFAGANVLCFCAPLIEKQWGLFFFAISHQTVKKLWYNMVWDNVHIFCPNGAFRSRRTNKSLKTKLIFVPLDGKNTTFYLFIFHRASPTSVVPPPVCSPGIYSGELFGRGGGTAAGIQQKYLPPSPHAPILCSPSSTQSHLLKAYPRHPRQGPIRNTLVQPRGDGTRQALLSGGCTRPRWGVGLGPGSEIWSGSDASGHLWSETKGWNNVPWCDLGRIISLNCEVILGRKISSASSFCLWCQHLKENYE